MFLLVWEGTQQWPQRVSGEKDVLLLTLELVTEYMRVLSFREKRGLLWGKKANMQLRGYLIVKQGLTISLVKTISPTEPQIVWLL